MPFPHIYGNTLNCEDQRKKVIAFAAASSYSAIGGRGGKMKVWCSGLVCIWASYVL